MRSLISISIFIAFCGLLSCTCDEMFTVDPQTLSLPLQVTDNSDGNVFFFNKPVDTTTVIPGKTLLFNNAEFTGFHFWSKDRRVLTLGRCDIHNPKFPANISVSAPTYPYEIVFDGTISDGAAVRATDGSPLDGNRDNTGGDDYVYKGQKQNCFGLYTLVVTNLPSGTCSSLNTNNNRNAAGNMFLDFRFSNPIDPATVALGDAFYLENTSNNTRIPGQLTLLPSRNTIRFVSTGQYDALRPGAANCRYRFVIKAVASVPLKSVYDRQLSTDFTLSIQML
jgi:hypothetical protein